MNFNPLALVLAFVMIIILTPIVRRVALSLRILDHPDNRFMAFCSATPDSSIHPVEWKVSGFKTKKILCDVAKGIVPDKIIHRPKTGGWGPIPEVVEI